MPTSRSLTALNASVRTRTRASDAESARAADATAISEALLLGDAPLFEDTSDPGRPFARRGPPPPPLPLPSASAASRFASAKTKASGDDVALTPRLDAVGAERPVALDGASARVETGEAAPPPPFAATPPADCELSGDATADTECTGLRVEGTCVTRTPIFDPEMTRDSTVTGGVRGGRVGEVDGGRIILDTARAEGVAETEGTRGGARNNLEESLLLLRRFR